MRQKVNYHLHLPYALTLFVSLLASVLSSHSLHMSAASVIFSQFSLSASVCPAPRWRPLMLTPRWRRARPPARLWICPAPRTPVRTCSPCRPTADSFGSSTWIFNPIGWVLDGGSRGPEAGRWPWAVRTPWSGGGGGGECCTEKVWCKWMIWAQLVVIYSDHVGIDDWECLVSMGKCLVLRWLNWQLLRYIYFTFIVYTRLSSPYIW